MSARLLLALAVLPAFVACTKRPAAYVPDSSAVAFDITPLPKQNGAERWAATYTSQGKTARFRIELGAAKAAQSSEPLPFDLKVGEGRLVAEPGSDSSVLLADLKRALEAKQLPDRVARAQTVPFTFASLGENQLPSGRWSSLKLFFGEGEQECEVFLNLNPAIGKAEFSIKDSDYGDLLLAQFAKVL